MPSNDKEVWRRARRKYMERHPERVAENRRKQNKRLKENGYYKNWALQKKYGMSLAEFDALFESQGKVCAICKTSDFGKRGTFVDHCHKTGAVRGVLCCDCNFGIARLKDDPSILQAAISYLQK